MAVDGVRDDERRPLKAERVSCVGPIDSHPVIMTQTATPNLELVVNVDVGSDGESGLVVLGPWSRSAVAFRRRC